MVTSTIFPYLSIPSTWKSLPICHPGVFSNLLLAPQENKKAEGFWKNMGDAKFRNAFAK